jgi:acyl-CoA thioester hydrolase
MSERQDRPTVRPSSIFPAPLPGGRFPITQDLPVLWGDLDAQGHVNNTRYFRWLEETRVHFFRTLSFDFSKAAPAVPVLASTSMDFLRPVFYPDTVRVEAKVTRLGRTSITMGYRLTSVGQGSIVATATAVVVLVEPSSGRPAILPDVYREAIKKLDPDVREAG